MSADPNKADSLPQTRANRFSTINNAVSLVQSACSVSVLAWFSITNNANCLAQNMCRVSVLVWFSKDPPHAERATNLRHLHPRLTEQTYGPSRQALPAVVQSRRQTVIGLFLFLQGIGSRVRD